MNAFFQRGKLRNSIRGRILLCITLTVVLSLLVLGSVSILLNIHSNNQILEDTLSETAVIASERVTQELTAYKNVALDAGCIARLADPTQSVASKQAIINQRAAAHQFVRGNIIGPDGVSIFDGKDYSDRDYFKQAMTGVPYVSEPLVSKITGELSIIIAAPLWAGGDPATNQVVGVVYFVPPETFLNDIVSKIQISAGGAAYAINASGVTIADNTLETITTQNIEEEAKADPSLQQLAAIHAEMRAGKQGFGEYEINGVKKLSAYAPIAGTDGWSIGITAPKSDFMDVTYFSVGLTIVLLLLSLIVTSVISLRLANGIGLPIQAISKRLSALAHGDLTSTVPVTQSRDEIGVLSEATHSLVHTISGIITDIDWGLGEMANGNFNITSHAQELYVEDFKPIATSMYKILNQLTQTLTQINQSAGQVSTGADQISAGAQALSQGATEQASAVEELAATIHEISGQVTRTAENAQQVDEKSNDVEHEALNSNQRMGQMLEAISEISTSSSEIGKIIKTIEDIAFQTNILALNAAVEAARAGEAGKGFAVVADEVRNLASKSAEASKSTSELISSSLRAVENGTAIANETAQSLSVVVSGIQEVTKTINQISNDSAQQSQAISQVTQGIEQISSVVQTNSATAEESAAASEELSGQAQLLKELVDRFQLSQGVPDGMQESL